MRTDLTNSQLLALHNDIQKECNASPAFYYFNKEKTKRFYQQNGLLLKLVETKMAGFIKKYVKHTEPGDGADLIDWQPEPITEEKDGQKVYVFETPELEKEYLTELDAFMTRVVKIEL